MWSRIVVSAVAIFVSLQSLDAVAQSSSYYLTNRSREIRRATSSSYFENRSSTNSVLNRAVPLNDYSQAGDNRNLFSNVRNKPFSNTSQGPSLSPYLGLGGLQVGSVPNYYSMVRPQLEQQRINDRAQQQQMAQQQELTQLAARSPYGAEGTPTMLPTGHIAVFQNFFGYYPQPGPPRR